MGDQAILGALPSDSVAVRACTAAGIALERVARLAAILREGGRTPVDLMLKSKSHPLITDPTLLSTLDRFDDQVLVAALARVSSDGPATWSTWTANAKLLTLQVTWWHFAVEPQAGDPPFFEFRYADWRNLEALFRDAGGRVTVDWGKGLAFSASRAGIWPDTTKGYHDPEARTYVTFFNSRLRAIAAYLYEARLPENGGRFFVYRDMVVRADTRELALQLGTKPRRKGATFPVSLRAMEDT